jgi:hypothetical protein
MLNQQSDSGPRGDEGRTSTSHADTAQSTGHLRMPASRQRRDAENPLRPGPENSYLQAGELGGKIIMPIAGLAADLTGGKRERTGSEHSHYYRNYFGRTKEPKWNRFSVPYRFYGGSIQTKWQV